MQASSNCTSSGAPNSYGSHPNLRDKFLISLILEIEIDPRELCGWDDNFTEQFPNSTFSHSKSEIQNLRLGEHGSGIFAFVNLTFFALLSVASVVFVRVTNCHLMPQLNY